MSNQYKNFIAGVGLIPNSTDQNTALGDINSVSSSNTLNFHNGGSSSPILTIAHYAQDVNKVLNKDFDDATTRIINGTTVPKMLTFDLSGAIAGSKTTFTFIQNTDQILTFPNATDTLVGKNTSDIFTNKTISGLTNTFTNIANSSLVHSNVTINGSSVSLGGSITITASTTSALTIGTGLSGTSFNGSTPVTIAIDSTVVTLSGSQVLTNKTLTSPIINTATADTITAIAGGDLTLVAPVGKSILLKNNSTLIGTINSSGLTLDTGKSITLTNTGTVTLSAASSSATYPIILPAAAPAANTALVYDGTNFTWGSSGGWSTASQTVSAGGTITISSTKGQQAIEVQGSAAVTLSSVPFGSSTFTDKVVVRLIGRSSTNTVTLTNNDSAKGCLLNGNITLYYGDVIELMYVASVDRWIECFRNK